MKRLLDRNFSSALSHGIKTALLGDPLLQNRFADRSLFFHKYHDIWHNCQHHILNIFLKNSVFSILLIQKSGNSLVN
jgi:hypothetical protein